MDQLIGIIAVGVLAGFMIGCFVGPLLYDRWLCKRGGGPVAGDW